MRSLYLLVILLGSPACLEAQNAARTRGGSAQLPDGPGKDVTQRVCGTTCHGPSMIMGAGRTRDQWTAVVNSMVARGAKATDSELMQVVNYLTASVAPNTVSSAPRPPKGAYGAGPGVLGGGAADSHVVDARGAERGKSVYIAECITCHGNRARGGNQNVVAGKRGPDLVRSLTVLHDRYGDLIGAFLVKGHPLQSGRTGASLSAAQVGDLADFLHLTVYNTLRSGSELKIQDILVGDRQAGAAYFNGPGNCSGCHSATGDLKGIGSRYDPPTLQSKFLFPRSVGFSRGGGGRTAAKPVTVKVTLPDGQVHEGVLDRLDDFNVSLHDANGDYLSFKRAPGVQVEKHDPLAAHVAMLDQYTDKQIHDVVAYLESLK